MDVKEYRAKFGCGNRVRTAAKIDDGFSERFEGKRRPNAVGRVTDQDEHYVTVVHGDGAEAPYHYEEVESIPGGILEGRRVYLAGPIEYAVGDDWRPDVKRRLKDEFGLKVFDPYADEKQNMVGEIARCRAAGDLEGVRAVAKRFVRADLSIVDHADFLIVHLPQGVATTGTHHEIIKANEEKKPVLLVCPQGKEFLPVWYIGFMPLRMMFGSFESVYEYLSAVDGGLHQDDDRWWFIYNYHRDNWLN